jgi:hypothetical protein
MVLAVLLTVFMPGKNGVYAGTILIALTFICLAFAKKKVK